MAITCREQLLHFGLRQFVGRTIQPAFFHEGERTIVHDKMLSEKPGRGAETLREQTPQSLPTDLAARAIQAKHGTLWMFGIWFADLGAEFHPVAHSIHLPKRHAGLHHS